MLFYRAVTVAIMAAEIYYLQKIQAESASGPNVLNNAVGSLGILLLYLNLIAGFIFLLFELFFPRDSATLQKVKQSYPYTETPLKIILLYTIGVSCAAESDSFFPTLQLLVQLDLVLSYLSYAWKSFWPILIIPVNEGLMYVNSAVLYVMRIIRGTSMFDL